MQTAPRRRFRCRSDEADRGRTCTHGHLSGPFFAPCAERRTPCPSSGSSFPIILPIPAFCGSCCPASAPCCSPPSTASWTACVSPTLWARRPLRRSTSSCRCPCCWAPSALCWAPAAAPSWASRWARATRKRPTAILPCSCWRLWSRSVCWRCWALCSCGPLPCCWVQRESFWTTRCAMDAS